MLNWDLLDENEQERVQLKERIRYLERTIDAFKKYDEKRKEYVHSLECELDSYRKDPLNVTVACLRGTIKGLNLQITKLQSKLAIARNPDLYNDDACKASLELNSLRHEVNKLKSVNNALHQANSELVSKLFANEDALVLLDIIEKKLLNALE